MHDPLFLLSLDRLARHHGCGLEPRLREALTRLDPAEDPPAMTDPRPGAVIIAFSARPGHGQ